MTRLLLVLVVCSLGACSGSGAPGPGTPARSSLSSVAAETLALEADRPRQQLIKDELERTNERQLSFSAKSLDALERSLLQALLAASQTVDDIHLLQGNRKALDYRAEVERSGTADDRRLFQRNAGPWCRHNDDVRCSTLRNQPPRVVGGGVWPEGLSQVEQRRQASDPVLGHPLTVVQRKGSGFAAVPLHRDPLLGPRVRELATRLQAALRRAAHPTLAAYLRGRVGALLAEKLEPPGQAELDWTRLRGKFEVMVGPWRAGGGGAPAKPRMGMLIAYGATRLTGELQTQLQQLPTLEGRLSRLLGRKLYSPRDLGTETVRAVEVAQATGSLRLESGVLSSLELRAAGSAASQAPAETKRVLLVNHLRAQGALIAAQARSILEEGLLGEGDAAQAAAEQAAFEQELWRELCRGLGPQPDHEITAKQGRTTLQKGMGDLGPLLLELQGELIPLWALGESQAQLKLGKPQVALRLQLGIARLIGLVQGDPEELPAQAAAVILGALLEQKAASFDQESGRWSVKARQLPRALRELTRRVLLLELGGDSAGAAKLVAPHLTRKPSAVMFSDRVDAIRSKTKSVFQGAGLKPLSLTHQIVDLNRPAALAWPAPAAAPATRPPESIKRAEPAKKAAPTKRAEPSPAAEPGTAPPQQ